MLPKINTIKKQFGYSNQYSVVVQWLKQYNFSWYITDRINLQLVNANILKVCSGWSFFQISSSYPTYFPKPARCMKTLLHYFE